MAAEARSVEFGAVTHKGIRVPLFGVAEAGRRVERIAARAVAPGATCTATGAGSWSESQEHRDQEEAYQGAPHSGLMMHDAVLLHKAILPPLPQSLYDLSESMRKAALLAVLVLSIAACQDSSEPVTSEAPSPSPSPPPSPSPTPSLDEEEEAATPEEPDLVAVPDVEGQRLADARRDLKEAGLGVTISKRPSDETPGTVLSQRPISGIDVRSGRTIRLVVAKPRPEPAANCHPSYTGACLDPNASDYDCAGGSGDGPKYTGTVTVVGPDVFGLDGDSDGIGCE